jgi:hypothetical protein
MSGLQAISRRLVQIDNCLQTLPFPRAGGIFRPATAFC